MALFDEQAKTIPLGYKPALHNWEDPDLVTAQGRVYLPEDKGKEILLADGSVCKIVAVDGLGQATIHVIVGSTGYATVQYGTTAGTAAEGNDARIVAAVAHEANTSNPHNTTKAQLDLGNVDNTSDANKPVSTAQATAISTAQSTATSDAITAIQNGVATNLNTLYKIALAINNDPNYNTTITTLIGTKESSLAAGTISQYYRGDKTWQTLDKAAVGLPNVPNVDCTNASNILTGTLPLSVIPKAALERVYVYTGSAITPDLMGLTTTDVQNGDAIKIENGANANNGRMWVVADDLNLNVLASYVEYSVGYAASVPWSGVTGKPTTVNGYGITDILNQTLTGLTTLTNSPILITDEIIIALGKLQAQITDLISTKVDKVNYVQEFIASPLVEVTSTVPKRITTLYLKAGNYNPPTVLIGCTDTSKTATVIIRLLDGTNLSSFSATGILAWKLFSTGFTLDADGYVEIIGLVASTQDTMLYGGIKL